MGGLLDERVRSVSDGMAGKSFRVCTCMMMEGGSGASEKCSEGAMSQGFIGLADGGVWCYCLLRIVV